MAKVGLSKRIIRTYQQIASDLKLLLAVVGTQLVVTSVISQLSSSLGGTSTVPDRYIFGYTVNEINQFYTTIGLHGRTAYYYTALFDLFPFMETYTLCLGSICCYLLKYNQRLLSYRRRYEILLLFPLAMIFDAIETIPMCIGSYIYPYTLPNFVIQSSSFGNQGKWGLLTVGFLVIIALTVDNYVIDNKKLKTNNKSNSNKHK